MKNMNKDIDKKSQNIIKPSSKKYPNAILKDRRRLSGQSMRV